MSWITPTSADVLASLPEAERDLYAGLQDGGEDVIGEMLGNAVAMIRSRVAACDRNTLDPDTGTIPSECKSALMAIVRYELIGRLNAEEMSDSDPRTKLYNNAMRFLDSIARCEAMVEAGVAVMEGHTPRLVSRDPAYNEPLAVALRHSFVRNVLDAAINAGAGQ
jgi:hypothetical protein